MLRKLRSICSSWWEWWFSPSEVDIEEELSHAEQCVVLDEILKDQHRPPD